jgi:hypothetical protein
MSRMTNQHFLEEIFALDEQTDAFPIAFDVISKAQLANNKIQQCITKKYGHIPVLDKQQIANPSHSIAVDTIGPWIILQSPHSLKSKEPMTLQELTIIDLNMHFMEIVALKNKESITIARSLNQVWLCRSPRPVDCLHDMGQNSSPPNFKNFFNHMEFDPN